jgi:YgiT-type zinc finger domain-containing protein
MKTDRRGAKKGFWAGERCEYCGGPLVEKHVELLRKTGEQYVLMENVPAGVCADCGTRYYAANVLKMIEEALRRQRPADREITMPVYSLSA